MNKFSAFQTFVAAAEQGSFSGAARKLRTTASTVTKTVSRLEDELGVRLFNRTTRRLALTDHGQVLLERAKNILNEVDEAENLLRNTSASTRGTVRLVVPNLFGRLYLIPALDEFYRRHKDVTLQVHFSDRPVDLIESGFDLGVHTGDLSDSSIIRRKLTQGPLVTAAAPSYLAAHGRPQTPDELLNHNCLYGRFGGKWLFRKPPSGRQTIHVSGNLAVYNGDVLREAAVRGLGIVHSTWWAVRKDLLAGNLEEILPEYAIEGSPVSVIFPSRRLVPARVRAVIDYLVEITEL
ncbi:LysR family transcriptional regulator [Frigidibacter sp. ROC022]|uniref:LysR family transcriptional regulator n=1 Tax=Frigidibacter sp. ROC022 TaxID=2971796 RepID=UPI00215B2ED1|nr:LysR family transcriptional regulator [Frigidibacter sp. ROC022]MCR8724537.1 LysR family transcriptional regulator [Frigidibacter sp. ROC022]